MLGLLFLKVASKASRSACVLLVNRLLRFKTTVTPAGIAANALANSEPVFWPNWNQCDWRGVQYFVADKGYDYSVVRNQIIASGNTFVIPRRKWAFCPGVRDKERYKTRSAIEWFFEKIKENKRTDSTV